MLIDYHILLINLIGGLLLLGVYTIKGHKDANQKKWGVCFVMTGALALVFGTPMALRDTPREIYTSGFAEMSLLFSVVYLGTGLSLLHNWDLRMIPGYACASGILALVLGVRIIGLGLTNKPLLTGWCFILTGVCGMFSMFFLKKQNTGMARKMVFVIIMITAFIWILTGYIGLFQGWGNIDSFSLWKSYTLLQEKP